jgi:hypothetical protein
VKELLICGIDLGVNLFGRVAVFQKKIAIVSGCIGSRPILGRCLGRQNRRSGEERNGEYAIPDVDCEHDEPFVRGN